MFLRWVKMNVFKVVKMNVFKMGCSETLCIGF